MSIFRDIKRKIKRIYLRFITLKGDPKHLAFSLSVGIFVGMMPIMPFQTILALFLAFIFRANKIAAFLGTLISNPLNLYFVYLWSYQIGTFLLGRPYESTVINRIRVIIYDNIDEPIDLLKSLTELGGEIISALLIGGIVLALIVAIPSYFFLKFILAYIQKWRINRKYRNRNDTPEL